MNTPVIITFAAVFTVVLIALFILLLRQYRRMTQHQTQWQQQYTRWEQQHGQSQQQHTQWQQQISEKFSVFTSQRELQQQHLSELLQTLQKQYQDHRTSFDKHQMEMLSLIQTNFSKAVSNAHQQVEFVLKQHTQQLTQHYQNTLTLLEKRIDKIQNSVDQKLATGFEKTTATFTDVIKRLSIIDHAQQKITALSNQVVSLQEILSDKKSRGAFGEVQLSQLIDNVIPPSHYRMQATLSNGKRVDCLLLLPEPTGNVAIDAKFPLENYYRLTEANASAHDLELHRQAFGRDIRKHIQDIADKYIIPGETADGAVLFIPAEAIFAEIHSRYSDIVDFAHRQRVWMASPSTLMAVLTTARAVIKDQATRKQVHIIQQHLVVLAKDFTRFQKRMDNLSRHIHQAQEDVEQVHKSSQKISSRFNKIEQVELSEEKLSGQTEGSTLDEPPESEKLNGDSNTLESDHQSESVKLEEQT